MEDGFEETAAFDLDIGQLGLQPVAERHQLFDLGDDAMLFGEGWDGDQRTAHVFYIHVLCSDPLVQSQ